MAKKETFLQEDDTNITPAHLIRRASGNETSQEVDKEESTQESVQVRLYTSTQTTNKTDTMTAKERQNRIDRATAMIEASEDAGETPILVTLRVPVKLHTYMENYVRRINDNNPNKRKKYRKQDAIAAAFVAFYADHPMPPRLNEEEDEL